jgi:hypothetical protein
MKDTNADVKYLDEVIKNLRNSIDVVNKTSNKKLMSEIEKKVLKVRFQIEEIQSWISGE